MGIRGGAQLRHAQNAAQPQLGAPYLAVFLLYIYIYTFRTQLFGRPVWQYTRRTHDATAREGASHVKSPGGLYNEFNTCFTYNPAACPWRGTCQINPSLAYRTTCIVLLSQQPFFNKQYIALTYYYFYIQICSVMTFCNRTLWYR